MAKLSPDALRLVRGAAEAERATALADEIFRQFTGARLTTNFRFEFFPHNVDLVVKALRALAAAAKRFPAEVDVLAERRRQVEVEGYDAAHDDAHGFRPLTQAAIAYAMSASRPVHTRAASPPMWWPWEVDAWKPKDARADLVRAVALGLAALEALDRATVASQTGLPVYAGAPEA